MLTQDRPKRRTAGLRRRSLCTALLANLFAGDIDPQSPRFHAVLDLHRDTLRALVAQQLSIQKYVADDAARLVVDINDVSSDLDRLYVRFMVNVEGEIKEGTLARAVR